MRICTLNNIRINDHFFTHVIDLDNDSTYVLDVNENKVFIVDSCGVLYDQMNDTIGRFRMNQNGHWYLRVMPDIQVDNKEEFTIQSSDLIETEKFVFHKLLESMYK